MPGSRVIVVLIIQLVLLANLTLAAPKTNGGRDLIKSSDLKEWLTYLASDELEGRATFSEGLGLAAAYIAQHLKSWGVKPGGPAGSYFQRVAIRSVKSANNSTVTVEANGQTRTFTNGEGIIFPHFVGNKRTFTADRIEFLGYGLSAPHAGHDDYAGKDVKGRVVVWLGGNPPKTLDSGAVRLLFGRSRHAIEQNGAAAVIGPPFSLIRPRSRAQDDQEQPADFVTAQRLDARVAPTVSGSDEFFEFLFSGAPTRYAELKSLAAVGEPLPSFTLKGIRISFDINAEYEVTRTQFTRNVVGIVEGQDAELKNSYVAFGAHYDHVGYAEGEISRTGSGLRRIAARGRVTPGAEEHRIWNGADDDGSGSVTIMAIARAFALGPKPRRSALFVWHSGEERGLWGSRYFVDHPVVPVETIVAQINMDMVGRNFQNLPDASNSVFVVGSDRISTELHNITVDANESLSSPLHLDFAMNDPSDPEQIYYRSDHYSYAAKGIPVVFLFTGIHPDYHANTDTIEKINFEKMEKIGKLAYEIGSRVADNDLPPARDFRGPRAGRSTTGRIEP